MMIKIAQGKEKINSKGGNEVIPFIGLSTDKTSSLGFKMPAEVEHDLRTILVVGASSSDGTCSKFHRCSLLFS